MIKNRQILFIVIVVLTLGVVSVAEAGMVNYQRRAGVVTKGPAKKPAYGTAAAKKLQAPTTNNTAANAAAAVASGSIKVANVVEKRFDANNDGILQADEQKKFLREVLDTTQAKGGYTVNSDLLKKYDVNGDGVITRYEVSSLQIDAR